MHTTHDSNRLAAGSGQQAANTGHPPARRFAAGCRLPAARCLVLCALCLVAAACSDPQAAAAEQDYLGVVIRASPNNLDPRIGTDENSQRVSQLVFSRLMELSEDFRVIPHLAARLDNPDPLTYIAHLRSGVKFHDGRELTAKDVVYTFGSFLDPDFISPRKGAYRQLASVRPLDDYRVEFKLQ